MLYLCYSLWHDLKQTALIKDFKVGAYRFKAAPVRLPAYYRKGENVFAI